jgi:hypothetical protein
MSKTSPVFAPKKPMFVIVGVAVMAIASWYSVDLSQLQPLNQAVNAVKTQLKEVEKSSVTVAVPKGWKAENPTEGVTAYTLPSEYKTASEYDAVNDIDTQDSGLDGTRYPYVSDISEAGLIQDPHNSNHYSPAPSY